MIQQAHEEEKKRMITLLRKEYGNYVWLGSTKCGVWSAYTQCTDIETVVDYLLSNGAMMPPCKVGDTVYVNIQYLLPDGSYRTEGPVVGQVCSICFHKDGNEIEIEGDDPYFEKASIYRSSADFGNNVFLTKEAAEQVLRGRDDNGT